MKYSEYELAEAYRESPIDPERAVIIGETARVFAGLLDSAHQIDALISLDQYQILNDGVGWYTTDNPKALKVGYRVPIFAMFSTQGLNPENYEQVSRLATTEGGIRFVHRSILIARDRRVGLTTLMQ